MARGLPQAPKWAWVVMALSAICLITGSVLAVNRPEPPPFTAPTSAGDPELSPPVAVFLGDSWGEGTGSERPGGGLADQVAVAQGWQLINGSQGGTGYVTGAPPEYPERAALPERVADVVAAKPDVVVVAAGINDANRDYSEQQIRDAVSATLTGLVDGLPDTSIVVIGPWSVNSFPTPSLQLVDRVVSEEATARGLPFVSPIAAEWITGSNDGRTEGNRVEFIGPDGAHPTQAGHDYLAAQVNAWLDTIPDLPTSTAG